MIKDFKTYEASVRWYKGGKLGEPIKVDAMKEYKDFITDDVFRQFLIDNGAYDKYIKNVLEKRPTYADEFSTADRREYLNHCFTWSSTPEHDSYWSPLNDRWKNKIFW